MAGERPAIYRRRTAGPAMEPGWALDHPGWMAGHGKGGVELRLYECMEQNTADESTDPKGRALTAARVEEDGDPVETKRGSGRESMEESIEGDHGDFGAGIGK